nr:CFI-box-CTERM domain-containing protein [Roseicyclus sp.]
MAVNNVELAAFWAVQQQNDVSLAQREGTNTELRPGGKVFSYLSENTQGLRAIELDRPSRDFDIHAFGSDARQFLVINARLAEAQTIELDLTRFSGTVDSGWVHILTAAEGQDPRDPNVDTEIEDVPLAEVFNAGALSLTLDPWEVAFVSLELDASDGDNGPPDDDDGSDDDDEQPDDDEAGTGGTCFVATCAYGNANHPDVADLRLYRDNVLSQTALGRHFIIFYYRFGPYLARWMEPYPRLKQITKLALSRFVKHHRQRMAARTDA